MIPYDQFEMTAAPGAPVTNGRSRIKDVGFEDRLGKFLKFYGYDGFLQEGMSFLDMFGAPGNSAMSGPSAQDIEQVRGWNHTAILAKSLQFALGTLHVFTDPQIAARLEQSTGDDTTQAAWVSGIESYEVPSDWVLAPSQHRVCRLMRKPNPWCDQAIFKFQISQQVEAHGVCYLLVLPNERGLPSQIHIIPKGLMTPLGSSIDNPEGLFRTGNLSRMAITHKQDRPPQSHYEMLQWLSNREYSSRWVIPIGLPSLIYSDDFLNPTSAMADALDTDKSIHTSRRSTLQNQMTAGPMLVEEPGVDLQADEREQLLAEYHARHSGPDNQGKAFWKPKGVGVDNSAHSAREMEYSSSAVQSREDILGQRMTPPALVGLGKLAGHSGVSATVKTWSRLWGQPMMRLVAGQLTLGLQRYFTEPQDQFMVVLQAGSLDDPEVKQAELSTDIAAQAITTKEYRERRNMEPFGDERDDAIVGTLASAGQAPGGMGGQPGIPAMPGLPTPPGVAGGETGNGQPGRPGVPEEMDPLKRPQFGSLSRREFSNTRKGIAETLEAIQNGKLRPATARVLLRYLQLSDEDVDALLAEIEQQEQEDQEVRQHLQTQTIEKSADLFDGFLHSDVPGLFSGFTKDSDCGANAPGGGGFQPGNDCASEAGGRGGGRGIVPRQRPRVMTPKDIGNETQLKDIWINDRDRLPEGMDWRRVQNWWKRGQESTGWADGDGPGWGPDARNVFTDDEEPREYDHRRYAANTRTFDPNEPDSVSFVSPSIRESAGNVDKDVEIAIDEIDGSRHARIKDITKDVDSQLELDVDTRNAVGVWSDGAENSLTMTTKSLDHETWVYATALKAKIAKQKDAIAFTEDPNGTAALHAVLIPSRNIAGVRRAATAAGLEYHTIEEAGRSGLRVYVFDPSGSEDVARQVELFGEQNNAREGETIRGHGEFLTNEYESRARATRTYNQRIREYEEEFPTRRHYREGKKVRRDTRGRSRSRSSAVTKSLNPPQLVDWRKGYGSGIDILKSDKPKNECGANAPGGGGFQPGNQCSGEGSGDSDGSETGKKSGEKKEERKKSDDPKSNVSPSEDKVQSADTGDSEEYFDPDPDLDEDGDGVTDASRVGVPAKTVPPPPKIPRLPGLTDDQRKQEKAFAERYEKDPDVVAAQYRDALAKGELGDAPNIFGTDDAKMLHGEYADNKENRSRYNVALHQTANAIAKRAFVQHMDEVVSKMPPEAREILVTAGGVAAGKGFSIENNPEVAAIQNAAAAVWDSAGEQYSTELPWIMEIAEKHDAKVTFVYVHGDPEQNWTHEHPKRGVVNRAGLKGRMVDARLYVESYKYGAKNFEAFRKKQSGNERARFAMIDNRGKPAKIDALPPEASTFDTESALQGALKKLRESSAPDWVKEGGDVGSKIWKKKQKSE